MMTSTPWSESDSARRFMWAVQALALDASAQGQLFPEFAEPPDELELDQQETQAAFLRDWGADIAPPQKEAIERLDAQLESMGGSQNAHIWTVEALGSAPEWARVRELAATVLQSMGWPLALPPRDRAIYVGPPTGGTR